MEDVVRCNLCRKPFDEKSSLKRHGYYCRTRRQSHKINSRARACEACVKAKAKCDDNSLACARCAAKGIICKPSKPTTIRKTRSKFLTQSGIIPYVPGSAATSFQVNGNNGRSTEIENLGLVPSHCAQQEVPWEFSSWVNDGLAAEDMLSLQTPQSEWMTMDASVQSPIVNVQPTIIIQPASGRQVRSFEQRPPNRAPRATTTMMARILTSYPRMMQSQESLPPFIHPFSLVDRFEPEGKPFESVTTCLALMQMAAIHGPGKNRLIWKNIRLECERIRDEWSSYDKWGLLSAMQAILIYMLIRLYEGETENNNIDILMLSTVVAIAFALNLQLNNGTCVAPSGLPYGPSHEEWVFEESRRRIAIVFACLRMIFIIDPFCECALSDDFLLAPLPKRKQLWAAADPMAWAREMALDNQAPNIFGITLQGDMRKMKEAQAEPLSFLPTLSLGDIESNESNWQEWCANMDGMGSLITLAATLPHGLC